MNNFYNKCYELLKLIPKGKVTTYGEIAKTLNSKAWRAVGSAMAKNKNPVILPCHRVVRSDGTLGEYSLGTNKKIRLLTSEGIEIKRGKIINFNKVMHHFK